jgi:hypothetical protein
MTHLSGATLNIFNTAEGFWKTPYFYLFKLSTANAHCWGALPLRRFDNFNKSVSYTKLSFQRIFKEFSVFSLYFLFFFKRITFRGKSYRIRFFKRYQKFTLNFNYSHWTKVILSPIWGVSKRKRKKERDRPRYMIFTADYSLWPDFTHFFKHIRFYNCYTMRGLRFRTQPIIRRFGKLSQHVSILH